MLERPGQSDLRHCTIVLFGSLLNAIDDFIVAPLSLAAQGPLACVSAQTVDSD